MVGVPQLLAFSVVTSYLVCHHAPVFSIARSYVATAIVTFILTATLQELWQILVARRYLTPLKHLPQPPPETDSWILGNGKALAAAPTGVPHTNWINSVPNDGIIMYRSYFNVPRVFLTSPKLLSECLVTKNYDFIKPPRIRYSLGKLLGIGVLLAEGDEHKHQRKELMPAFAYRHVKDLYPTFWAKSRELVNTIAAHIEKPSSDPDVPSNVVEVGGWMSRATLDIISLAGMGQDFGTLQDPSNRLSNLYRRVFSLSGGGILLQLIAQYVPEPLLMPFLSERNKLMAEANTEIKRVCRELIATKRATMEKGGKPQLDILSCALDSGSFTDDDLVNQMMTFLVAGHETTSTSMVWAVYALCKHPEVQAKLREEVTRKLPSVLDNSAQIDPAEVDKCEYLQAVCNEVLRFHAPVVMTMRQAAHDTSLDGHFIPKDTTVILALSAVNKSKQMWGEDAQEFKPERWLLPGQSNSGGAKSNFGLMTFLHGPRSCIGQAFAKAEFACLLAAFVGHLEFELNEPDKEPELKSGVTTKPKHLDLKIKVNEDW